MAPRRFLCPEMAGIPAPGLIPSILTVQIPVAPGAISIHFSDQLKCLDGFFLHLMCVKFVPPVPRREADILSGRLHPPAGLLAPPAAEQAAALRREVAVGTGVARAVHPTVLLVLPPGTVQPAITDEPQVDTVVR